MNPNVEIVDYLIIMIDDKFVDGAENGSNLYANFTVGGIAGYGIFMRKRF